MGPHLRFHRRSRGRDLAVVEDPELSAARILLVSGSLRDGSTNSAVLRTAVDVAPPGVEATLFDGLGSLPHFNPDDDHEPLDPAAARLREAIAASDAVLFSTPEYAGALPGSFKNLLDWTVGGGEIYGKAVAWINASSSPTGAAGAHASLRTVLGYVGADVVEAACANIPVGRTDVGPMGIVTDPGIRRRVADVLRAMAAHVTGGR